MTQNRSVWTFDPIDPEGWKTSHRRVLLLAAEPNGGNPNGGVQDMGHWFRAAPDHNFFSAWPFYSHSAAYAAAAGGGKEAFRHDNCLTRDNAPAFRDALKAARFADLKHTGDRAGGSITAALFLREFVGTTPWIHCDIAGPSLSTRAYNIYPKGGTGHGVLTFLRFLETLA